MTDHRNGDVEDGPLRLEACSASVDAAFVPAADIGDWASEIAAMVRRHGCTARLEGSPSVRGGNGSTARLVVTTWAPGQTCCEDAVPVNPEGSGWLCERCGAAARPAEVLEVDLDSAWAVTDAQEDDGLWLPREHAVLAAAVEHAWRARRLGATASSRMSLAEL